MDPKIISTNITDYDLTKVPNDVKAVADSFTMPYKSILSFLRDKNKFLQFYVWRNLLDEKNILFSKDKILASASCDQSEVMPQTFLPNFFLSENSNYGYWSKDSAHLPGMTNAIVIRNHLIFPDPWISSFRQQAINITEKHTGVDTVHFIDDAVYHFNLGEVHCATNLIREPDLDFKF